MNATDLKNAHITPAIDFTHPSKSYHTGASAINNKGLILAGGTLVWNLIKLWLEGSLRSMRLEEVGAGKKGAREEDVGVSPSRASSFFLPNAFCYAG